MMNRSLATCLTILVIGPLAAVDVAPPKDIAAGTVSGLSSMDAADIDGDGLVDVLAVEGGKHAGGRRTFAWFKSPADTQGSWTRHDIVHGATLRSFLGATALVDIDGDGDRDIVVASDNHSGSSKQADVLVFFNPGGGTGSWTHHSVTGTQPWHHVNDLVIGDCDGDGKPDIVVRSLEPNTVHLLLQNSPTSWTRRSIDTGLSQSEGLGLGDLDDDGLPDITFTGYWLDSPADPRTQDYVQRPIDAAYHQTNQNTKEFVADIDGDGDLDVVIGPAESYRGGADHHLAWYANPGTGYDTDWPRQVIQASTNQMHTIKGGDMDGDGDIDLVVGKPWNPKEILIWSNDGSGGFGSPHQVIAGKGLYSGVLADLGADGDLDIVGQDVYAGSGKPWVYENLSGGGGGNRPPSIDSLSADPELVTGTQTTVTATTSDPDGDAVRIAWLVTGPAGTAPVWEPRDETVTITFDRSGAYIVTAVADDGEATASASTTIEVAQTATTIVVD